MPSAPDQAEFSFESRGIHSSQIDGLTTWRKQRLEALSALARKTGLPIGHAASVWLIGGVRLHGILRLYEETLLLPEGKVTELRFEIDGVPFTLAEMESCVRAD